MEAPVRRRHRGHVALVGGPFHLALDAFEGGHDAVRQPSHRVAYGLGLQELADPVDLLQVGERELRDEVAPVYVMDDQALGLQGLQGLAKRHPAHLEPGREGVLTDLPAGPELPAGDGAPQFLENELLGGLRPPLLHRAAHRL